MGRNVENRVATVFAGKPDDHLSGLNNFSRARAGCGDCPRRIGLEFGEAHQVVCGLELGFGGVDLRLSGLLRLRRDIEIGPRRPSLRKKRLLAFEMIARLRQLPLSGRETCLRLPQGVQLVLRFKSCHYLPGLHPIAELAAVFQQPPGNSKRQVHFVLSLDTAGKCKRLASLALLNGYGPNWTGCRSCGVSLLSDRPRATMPVLSQQAPSSAIDAISSCRSVKA